MFRLPRPSTHQCLARGAQRDSIRDMFVGQISNRCHAIAINGRPLTASEREALQSRRGPRPSVGRSLRDDRSNRRARRARRRGSDHIRPRSRRRSCQAARANRDVLNRDATTADSRLAASGVGAHFDVFVKSSGSHTRIVAPVTPSECRSSSGATTSDGDRTGNAGAGDPRSNSVGDRNPVFGEQQDCRALTFR